MVGFICLAMVQPAATVEMSSDQTEAEDMDCTEPRETEGNSTAGTEPIHTEESDIPPEMTQSPSEPSEEIVTEPLETEVGDAGAEPTTPATLPEETVVSTEEPTVDSTEALLEIAETEPIDAGQLETDLPVVSGNGISFRLFNYSLDINKTAAKTAWRPISQYFTFRNSKLVVDADPALAHIPKPNINAQHDQDGFTKSHATVERVLQDGYPVLDLTRNADGTPRTDPNCTGRSLAYLFSSGDHAVTAYRPSNTILQRSGNHYWYNSASHAVDFDVNSNLFRLREYVERNSVTASYGAAYGDFLPFTYTGGQIVGEDAGGTAYHVLNEDTDYWFGMTMQVNFYQTKGGKLGSQDMIFSFSGDDDVWVFVDDVLVLDLGGTHGTVDGSINFATGEIRQYLSWGGANATEAARSGGSDTSFPTTLRECFDATGRVPNGGWSADGKTFSGYTEHTLKFFYLERGSSVANCKSDFHLPTLPDKSLTVTKDLVPSTIDGLRDFVADTLSYRFRVMRADETGNATVQPFITAGMTYDLLENGIKIGTGIVDADNTFSLKVDQSAQFSDMLRKGKGATAYVVEEILPSDLTGQYSGVEFEVSGAGGDTKTEDGPAEDFTSFQTTVLSAEETQLVTFRNRVDTQQLCTLMITKRAADGTQIPQDILFPMQVMLGDALLPVGTTYTVAGDTRVVETAGIVQLREGETAILDDGILSGTAFEITELCTDQLGYRPSYSGAVEPAGTVDCTQNGASGIFLLGSTAQVTVTNADYDFAVTIPIHKQVLDGHRQDTFDFVAEQLVMENGVWQVGEAVGGTRITVNGAQQAAAAITIGYRSGTEGVFHYRIREQSGSGDYIYDSSIYYVEVTVDGGTASITRIWKEGGQDQDEIYFINRATTRLTVTKTVEGTTGTAQFHFTAAVTLNGTPFSLPQPPSGAGWSVEENVFYFSLAHGESVTLPHIPIGAVVTVTEHDHGGFLVFNELAGVEDSQICADQRQITLGNTGTTLHVINQTTFRLPDTGGGGTAEYTAAGTLFAGLSAISLYTLYFRRKEEDASS